MCSISANTVFRADMLSFAAEKVVRRLHHEGFEAYVVGGAVRDLLWASSRKILMWLPMPRRRGAQGVSPQPHYRAALSDLHVMVGPETIKVTTFPRWRPVQQNEHGRIMKTTLMSNMEEDAMRRDLPPAMRSITTRCGGKIVDFHDGA